jgi:hypothetical protein
MLLFITDEMLRLFHFCGRRGTRVATGFFYRHLAREKGKQH